MLVRPGSTIIPSTLRTVFDICERVLPLRSSVTLEALIVIAPYKGNSDAGLKMYLHRDSNSLALLLLNLRTLFLLG